MVTSGTLSRLRGVRVWLGHALLAAFLLKALIPAGFMPDFSGRDGETFKIVICTANGTKVIDANTDGAPQTGSLAKHVGEPCALGALVALPAPDLAGIAASFPPHAALAAPMAMAVALPPARAGPAHGSRAPPLA